MITHLDERRQMKVLKKTTTKWHKDCHKTCQMGTISFILARASFCTLSHLSTPCKRLHMPKGQILPENNLIWQQQFRYHVLMTLNLSRKGINPVAILLERKYSVAMSQCC